MTNEEKHLTSNDIKNIAYAFQKSRILLTAIELKIFTVLNKHMLTSKEISEKIKTNEQATDRLLNALVAMGLLKKIHGKFYNSESASQFLVEKKTEFMSVLLHTNELWKSWNNLTDTIKIGTPVNNKTSSPNCLESFLEAMHNKALKEGKIITYLLDLKNVKKMLALGDGTGAFIMSLIEFNPKIQAVIFDLPEIIPSTKKYIENFPYKCNINFIEGDYLTDNIRDNYDLIFLSAIVHSNSLEENKALIKKCYDSLNPNGQIIIKDWIMNEERTSPAEGTIFALNMLLNTKHGDTYTESEIKEWFLSTGISIIEKKDTSFGFSLLIGHKK